MKMCLVCQMEHCRHSSFCGESCRKKHYYIQNKGPERIKRDRLYYMQNKTTIDRRNRKYCDLHKEDIWQKKKPKRAQHRERLNMQSRRWKADHRDVINRYMQRKYHSEIQFKMKNILRSRLRSAIKNNQKVGSAVQDLGCSIDFFVKYIESFFKDRPREGTGELMTWDNWSYNGWHIDHIRPLHDFDLADREQLLKACHYTNLQPLWSEINWKKSNNLTYQKEESEDESIGS